jgi:predicted permease
MGQIKLAFRMLAKTPFVTAVAILSLALGIGANAAIFSLFDQVILRELPVTDAGRLVNLKAPGPKQGSTSCNQAGDCDEILSYPMYRDLERADTGVKLAGHRAFGANIASDDRTLSGAGMLVSGTYFPVLGLRPAEGRLLGPDDDLHPGQHPVTVLSHDFWTREMGADPGVVGETLIVNGASFEIVGVGPEGFEGTTLGGEPDVFVPLTMRAQAESYFPAESLEDRRSYWLYAFGRLEPGVSLEQAAQGLERVWRPILVDIEAPLQEGMSEATLAEFRAKPLELVPGAQGQSGVRVGAREPLALLLALAGVVLLIACANIANLLLARGAGRAAEFAVRNSLGASRMRLVGQLFTESLMLAVLGGLASLLVARWTLSGIASLVPENQVASLDLALDPTVMAFTAVVALTTGLFFGLYPALHATRPDLVTALKGSSGQPSGNRSAARFRTVLVTTQIALSVTLLVAAGLFVRSLVNVSRVDLGLQTEDLVTFSIAPMLNGYESEQSLALFERLEDELAAIPGVTQVTGALVPVLSGNRWGTSVNVEGFENGPDIDDNANYNEVAPGFLEVLGIPLLAGREFTRSDVDGTTQVAIVNQAFAEKFGLGDEVVGKWMSQNGDDELNLQIVGLMADAKYADVKDEIPPQFVTPYRQDFSLGWLTFYLRGDVPPEQIMGQIQPLMRRLDPHLPVERLSTLERQSIENIFLDRLITTLAASFALLATLLAAIGLYGVLAYSVAQRTREIGVRMALGAGGGSIRRMVLGATGRMLVVGCLIGLVGAWATGKLAGSLLYGLEANDPLMLALGALGITVVALGSAYLPARRASKVDPMMALRYD